MDGTPIFDELRDLLDGSEDLFGGAGTPLGASAPAEAGDFPPKAEESLAEAGEGEAGEVASEAGEVASEAGEVASEAEGGLPGSEGTPRAGRQPAKIVIAGGRGAGKTTFVGSVSDTDPVTVEAADFGRIALHPDLLLYLLGTAEPEQPGFGGALGAVVLVDPRRVEDAFATISYFEDDSDVPFIVAVNMFDGQLRHDLDEVREALALNPGVPLATCDARDPASAAAALQELVSYAISASSDLGSPLPDLPE